MHQIYWIIKLSKLCNLRCSYCYEWNELDDPRRMSETTLTHLFQLAKEYHFSEMRRLGSVPQTVFVWHGGEPLVQPISFLEQVQAVKRAVIGRQAAHERYFRDVVQTNLFKLDASVLSFIKRHRMGVGVSLDVVPGVRRTLSGGETEARVMANLDRLQAAGIRAGAIAVLAKHTLPHVTRIYDFFAARGMGLRVLPLFDGPGERPAQHFEAGHDELVAGLCRLFDHWMASGCSVPLLPVAAWLLPVLRKILGVSAPPYDRSQGETYLLVNTDGKVYPPGAGYGEDGWIAELSRPLTAAALRSGERYRASLEGDARLRRETCAGCPFFGACDTYPLFEAKYERLARGRCNLAHDVMCHMERAFRTWGVDPSMLVGLLREHLGLSRDAA
ncbi:radical SAM protein [Sorangium sp. So ce269]